MLSPPREKRAESPPHPAPRLPHSSQNFAIPLTPRSKPAILPHGKAGRIPNVAKQWVGSSVAEHCPYKAGVASSTLAPPTISSKRFDLSDLSTGLLPYVNHLTPLLIPLSVLGSERAMQLPTGMVWPGRGVADSFMVAYSARSNTFCKSLQRGRRKLADIAKMLCLL